MIAKIIKTILEPRHFWRTVGFDELSELYTSQLLRSLSTSLVGIFVPVYLYKIGYTITAIATMFLIWFIVRPFWSYVSARIIALLGPKHAIALSVVLQILYLSLILSIESMNWPLALIGVVGSFCYGLYMMAFEVDFSKIKHSEHGGKELGYLQIFERAGAVAGPLVGGLVATFADPRYTIALAIVVMCASLVPIFLSAEAVRVNQVIIVKGFPFKRFKRNLLVSGAFHLENVVTATVWPLFLGAFVLTSNTYAQLGILTAISTAVAIFAVFTIGRLIDKDKGRQLLNIGAVINAVVHLFRPFVGSPIQALAVNLVNEPATAMYRMPFLKGRYDESDSAPGYRIVYFMIIEYVVAVVNIFLWGSIVIMSIFFTDERALQVSFIIGAIASLLITKQRFAALRN
jgi:MFS family permease